MRYGGDGWARGPPRGGGIPRGPTLVERSMNMQDTTLVERKISGPVFQNRFVQSQLSHHKINKGVKNNI